MRWLRRSRPEQTSLGHDLLALRRNTVLLPMSLVLTFGR